MSEPLDAEWAEEFFLVLVDRLRKNGVRCAITGGLACIEFGIVEHTEDCDLLSDPSDSGPFLATLGETSLGEAKCRYRGTMSAPLDARWLAGGWTSHFVWRRDPASAYLDVFGAPPRVEPPWWGEETFPFAARSTVAAMKRTQRLKDWSQATAIGAQSLAAGDDRGWLHLFDADTIRGMLPRHPPTNSLLARRPVLRLAIDDSPLLERAIQTEIDFWSRLDRLRLGVYRRAAADYAARVRSDGELAAMSLDLEHARRVLHASASLPPDPLSDYGRPRLIAEARHAISLGLDPALLDFLPAVSRDFDYGVAS